MLLDTAIHQAMGLNSITPQRELRLLPVVSQPDGGPWLEMLWQLCWHLQRLGYPVVVLDATAQESHRSPGLAQLLGALPVDLEEDVAAGADLLLEPALRRPVVITMDLGPLEEFTLVAQGAEALHIDEVIVLAVHLARARRAGGV